MKTCPFCAEDIQSAAVVCKHCGRDVKSGASHVQLVAPKKKTSIITWLAVGFFGLMFIGWLPSLFTASPPAAAVRPANATAAATPGVPLPRPAPAPPTDLLALVNSTDELSAGGGYNVVQGEVDNISTQSLKNVAAVATWYDQNSGFITSDTTLINYNPILPGQRSTYKVMSTHNPAMAKYSVTFKTLFGGALATRDDRKK